MNVGLDGKLETSLGKVNPMNFHSHDSFAPESDLSEQIFRCGRLVILCLAICDNSSPFDIDISCVWIISYKSTDND